MISIIIPAFNEERTIKQTLEKVIAVNLGKEKKEIVVVDDGSEDNTSDIVKNLAKENQNLIFIQHARNTGKGAAVKTGLKKATGDVIVIQDADLEYNPADIPRLIKPILEKKSRVVYGNRLKMKPVLFGKNKTPLLLHFFGNQFLSLVTSAIYGQAVSDMETGYKAFEKSVMKGVTLRSRSFEFEAEITAKIIKKGIKILEIPIQTKPRGYDEGKKIHAGRDGIKALTALVKYRFTN